MKLDNDTFHHVIRNAPLVSIDFIIKSTEGKILLGLRTNAPAKESWFVPGGRIYKNERIKDAVKRITKTEIGVAVPDGETIDLGIYEHLYADSIFGEDIGTHYIVLAKQFTLADNYQFSICDDQHSFMKWWGVGELLSDDRVHEYTKNYFLDL